MRFRNKDFRNIEGILKNYSNHNSIKSTDKTPEEYEKGMAICEFAIDSGIGNTLKALDELSSIKKLTLINFGKYSDVVKDVGTVKRVSELYKIEEYANILYGIGHVRTATMSSVNPVTAHPFCTSVLPDITVVHNGEITNAPRLKRRLQVMGYPFFAPTDTEVIAGYIAERLNCGYDLEEVCKDFVKKGDGPYTFLLATPNGAALVKDRYSLRPAMHGYNSKDGFYAVATDIVGLNIVGATEQINILGPGGIRIFPTKIKK